MIPFLGLTEFMKLKLQMTANDYFKSKKSKAVPLHAMEALGGEDV
jgi:hypothetical protein